jgi:hypothetical protein
LQTYRQLRKMLATKLDRLRCTQCSKTYKEVKLLNRHRREKHSQEQRWPCDNPGCSVNFQCLRFKNEHMKKQHADQIARSLSPDEQSGPDIQTHRPKSVLLPMPLEAHHAPKVPPTNAPDTPDLSQNLTVDRKLPARSVDVGESSSNSSDNFNELAFLQEQRAIALNDPRGDPEHPVYRHADYTQSFDQPSIVLSSETQSNSPLDHPGSMLKALVGSETAIEEFDDSRIEHTQAVITAIWDRDIGTLSKIIEESEIHSRFGEAATSGLFEKLMEDTTESTSKRQESRNALAEQSLLDSFAQMMHHLTPEHLALSIGFSEGVICLISHQNRYNWSFQRWNESAAKWLQYRDHLTSPELFPEPELLEPQCTWVQRFFGMPGDASINKFLWYHNDSTSPNSFSKLELPHVREQLTSCCSDPNKDIPGGFTWLEHATRQDKAAAVYVLLERGADRNAVLADGTPLADFALQNGRDTIAVLLLSRLVTKDVCGHPCYPYRHRILDNAKIGKDRLESQGAVVLKRLKFAAEAIGDAEGSWDWPRRERLEDFVDKISWAEARIRRKTSHQFIDEDLGFRISHLL